MGMVTATISVEDSSGPTPLDNVLVRVFQADGTTFISEAVTGAPYASGEVEFTLFGDGPGVDYVIRMSLDGWRFPAGASQTISVTDPPTPDNDFGPYGALVGPSSLVTTMVVKDQLSNAIDGVTIRVYDSPADTFVTRGETGQGADASGEATFPLDGVTNPGQEYIVRLGKPGILFADGAAQTIAVRDPLVPPDTNIFDFVGTVLQASSSSDPDMCRLSGTFTDVSLRPIKELTLVFKPCLEFPETENAISYHFTGNPTAVRDNILVKPVHVMTNADGYVSVDLPREGRYTVHIYGVEHPLTIVEFIRVPDAPGFSLLDVLFPYVASVSYDTDPIDLAVGETVEVGVTATMSNSIVVDTMEILEDLLEFSIDDTTVADVLLREEDNVAELSVYGKLAGSTTIEVERKAGTVAPRVPEVPALVVTPPAVNVT